MATEIAPSSDKSAKRAGWVLLGLALASPTLLGAVGILSAFKVGELTVQVGFGWLVGAVAIDFLTKRREPLTRANGRIVVAALALLMALVSGFEVYRDTQKVDSAKKELVEQFMSTSVRARTDPATELAPTAALQQPSSVAPAPISPQSVPTSEADRTVAFLNAMKVVAKHFAEESAAIDRKFNSVDLSTVLAAQNLTSKTGLDASRKKLDVYKDAIAQRDGMLSKHFARSEQAIHGAGMSEREVAQAMAGMNSSKGTVVRNYANLTTAQMASVKATEDILSFAQRGLGRITVQDNQPMFQTQPELDEYRRLIQALNDAASAEAIVTQKVQAQAQNSKQALADQLK